LVNVLEKNLGWFEASLKEESLGGPDLGPTLEAMIAACICHDLAPELAPRARSMAETARAEANAAFNGLDTVEFGPAKRLLLAASAGNALGCRKIPGLATYREMVLDALSGLTPADANRELTWARLLLSPRVERAIVGSPLPLPERMESAILSGPSSGSSSVGIPSPG